MRILLQRVKRASVEVEGQVVGAIGQGLLVLVCAMAGDDEATVKPMAEKVAKCRLFADQDGKTNLSVLDIAGEVLVVSQFTLAAQWKKGNRPGFSRAAPPDLANKLYEKFVDEMCAQNLTVATGQFAASMEVSLINDGPFTIWMDSQQPE